MGFFTKKSDKKSGDGLALTEWNDLNNAVAGYSGLTLALNAADKIGIGTGNPDFETFTVVGNVNIGSAGNDGKFNLVVTGNAGFGSANAPLAPLSISSATGKKDNPDGIMHITSDCILFGGGNKERQVHSAQISAGKHVPNSLNIVGMSSGKTDGDRKVEIWAEGGLKVNGSVSASQFVGDGSKLTNLSVGLSGVNLATTSGNVGIGTTSPAKKLHVEGSVQVSDSQEIYFAGNGQIRSLDDNHRILFRRTDNTMELREYGKIVFSSGSTTGLETSKMVIAANGNVGIGTGAPQEKLEVNGVLRLTGGGNTCDLWVESNRLAFKLAKSAHGSGKAVTWDGDFNFDAYTPSDVRLKTNITNEGNVLDRLMKLDVKNYNWKTDPDNEVKEIGFLAQDVQALFPMLVKEVEESEGDDVTLKLKYSAFGVLAVGAIKELKTEYDNRIKSLEKEVASLKKSLGAAVEYSS